MNGSTCASQCHPHPQLGVCRSQLRKFDKKSGPDIFTLISMMCKKVTWTDYNYLNKTLLAAKDMWVLDFQVNMSREVTFFPLSSESDGILILIKLFGRFLRSEAEDIASDVEGRYICTPTVTSQVNFTFFCI